MADTMDRNIWDIMGEVKPSVNSGLCTSGVARIADQKSSSTKNPAQSSQGRITDNETLVKRSESVTTCSTTAAGGSMSSVRTASFTQLPTVRNKRSASPLFSRLKKTLKLDPSLPAVEPQKVKVNGHAAAAVSTGTETPLDLSKKLEEEWNNKLLESPLDLSSKTATTVDLEDTKPRHLFGQELRYTTPVSYSSLRTASSIRRRNIQSSSVNPVLSALTANMPPLMSAALVQKMSSVRLQTNRCTTSKQVDSVRGACVVAAAQMLGHVESSSNRCSSDRTDRIASIHSGSRNVSIVKPAASSVSDTQLLGASFGPRVTASSSLHTFPPSLPLHTNQNVSPRYRTATPMSFDTVRTDRGVPLAQVFPSRVVTSAAQHTVMESVPSPVHCNRELLSKSPPHKTHLLDDSCPAVCATSTLSITSVSHAALTSLDNCNTVTSPISVPSISVDVSPPMPILSPNIPGSCFASHAGLSAVSSESCAGKWTCSKGILPPVETSPLSLSDRESIPDDSSSGHEFFSTHMAWDDNMSDGKDSMSDTCHTEDFPAKRPAFEVVGDCNRTLLSDISRPCYAAVAFDRSLLQNESGHRNFIVTTKYYHFFARKSYTVGNGPYDLDAVQSDKSSSPTASCSASRKLRLPMRLSSALKRSRTSKPRSRAMPTADIQQITFQTDGKDSKFEASSDILSKYDFTEESACKFLDKKVRKLHYRKLGRDDSVSYDVIGTVYSPTPSDRPKGSNEVVHSNTDVKVKSEITEASADPEGKPGVPMRTYCRRRKKSIPAEMPTGSFDSFGEIVGNTNETNNTVGERDPDSCRSARSNDVKTAVGSGRVKYIAGDASSLHSELTELSESNNSVHCKQDLLPDSAVVNGGRKNPHGKVAGVVWRKAGDANNNRGKTVNDLAASTSTASVSESECLKDVRHLKTEINPVGGSQQSESAWQTASVLVHTRAHRTDVTTTRSRSQLMSSVLRPQQRCSYSKVKGSNRSADGAVLLLNSKSDETVDTQISVVHDTDQQKVRSFRQLDKCTTAQPVATATSSKIDSSVTSSDDTDAQSKAKRSLLKQLKSSEGYIAEKNVRYSKSEDLFDDSSLLSREQRALRMALIRITKMEMKAAMKEARRQRKSNACFRSKQKGNHRCKSLSTSQTFSSTSKNTLTDRCTYSKTDRASASRLTCGTVSAARGRNLWARERVKAHTMRCRENVSRVNLRHVTRSCDGTADSASRVSRASDEFTVDSKLPISELSVDVSLAGSASTPKSSPASFSDIFRGNIPPEVKKLIVCHATGETVLHKAARLGYEDIVQWCCRTGYVPVNTQDNAGYTPLHGSCIGGHISIARCLIEYGADVNAASRLDGARPLHDAVESDCVEIVRLLLAAGADINLTTYSGKTAESLACSHDMRAFFRAHSIDMNGSLRDCGADVDWNFMPSWNGPSSEDIYDVLADPPSDCDEESAQQIVFEGSQQPFLPIYFLQLDKMRQSENFLRLQDVLQRVGMRREKFMSMYAKEVIVQEIGQKMSYPRPSAAVDEDSAAMKKSAAASSITRVEFVRMSDVIRRLLNIDISLISVTDRTAITHASHL